ncbi:hypothetical protein [Hydrogenophaga sp. 5NK40-0174]|uniref:hypothetical protein n=1 Tax=Hydrogenophaga sp. 5NK40-0174 TaxID=3127649 RepID=UPI003106CE76
MGLLYFVFDASDDGEGSGAWEAVASVRADGVEPARLEALRIEAQALSDAPGPRGPMEEGGVWDLDIHTHADGDWTCICLTLTGPVHWGESLLARLDASAE